MPRPCSEVLALLASFVMTIPAARAGEILSDQEAPSPALGHALPYSIYEPAKTPPPGQRWPVLYLLHGVNGTDSDWPVMGHVRETADALIADGRIKPLAIVMPNGGNSWFVDNPDPGGTGMMARAVTRDLVDHIDAAYPTLACRGGRAIGGVSMGGYGALLASMDHRDEYGAAISLSGALWLPMPDDEATRAKRPTRMFHGAYGDPLDWRRFNAWNVFLHVPAYVADPLRTPFYMTVGDADYPSLRNANAVFVDEIATGGATTPFRTDPGHHDWTLWSNELGPALEWLDGKLADHC
jgi:S-formylglutathione hydrolase FrmB